MICIRHITQKLNFVICKQFWEHIVEEHIVQHIAHHTTYCTTCTSFIALLWVSSFAKATSCRFSRIKSQRPQVHLHTSSFLLSPQFASCEVTFVFWSKFITRHIKGILICKSAWTWYTVSYTLYSLFCSIVCIINNLLFIFHLRHECIPVPASHSHIEYILEMCYHIRSFHIWNLNLLKTRFI